MKLQDLQYLPPASLATSQTLFRVQRARARPGSCAVGALRLRPIGKPINRFDVSSEPVGYFAESPETAIYETLVRRDTTSLSLSQAGRMHLLCFQVSRPLHLLDLRPHAASFPVLRSGRYSATQEIAEQALMAKFEGIVYRSAQHYGRDCFVVFGDCLRAFSLVWRKPLALPDGSVSEWLAIAIRASQVPFVL